MARILLIHKADNSSGRIFNDPDDVSINITQLSGEPAYATEGIGLADALWSVLPSATVDAMLARFTELNDDLLVARFKATADKPLASRLGKAGPMGPSEGKPFRGGVVC